MIDDVVCPEKAAGIRPRGPAASYWTRLSLSIVTDLSMRR